MCKNTYIGLIILITSFCSLSASQKPQSKEKQIVSKIVTNQAGKTYLEVDGKPVLYNSVQSWLPEDGDYELNMRKAHDIGYKVFTFWFPWRMIEPSQGNYDWEPLNQMIKQAEKYNMHLDVVWAGTNFCGGLDPRFTPDFVLTNTDFLYKDEYGRVYKRKQAEMGMCTLANYDNEELLAIESTTLKTMMEYLARRDTTHRVVFFQIQNEPNHAEWAQQGKEKVLAYCDALGKVIKESPYIIATRINMAHSEYEPFIETLKYIDCQGVDPFRDGVELIEKLASAKTKMPHIAENAAYENSSSLMAITLASGGFYNIYRLDYDHIWQKPGVYGDNWIHLHQTYDIKLFNEGINKMAVQVAEAPAQNMITFNTETDMPEGKYNRFKSLKGLEIGFTSLSKWRQQGVGFCLYKDSARYVMADNHCYFKFHEKVTLRAGYFNEAGEWINQHEPNLIKNNQGEYEFYYYPGECVRVSF